ncbi:netrin receptor unc-5 [Schistosoma japonicum]|nr:netrin receptor unc-5 [Schistosoma japonicum]
MLFYLKVSISDETFCYCLLVILDLEEKFQLEPVSTDLAVSKRLMLTCLPPEGDPDPEI